VEILKVPLKSGGLVVSEVTTSPVHFFLYRRSRFSVHKKEGTAGPLPIRRQFIYASAAPSADVDAWIAKQKEPDFSRPEAIRRLVETGLKVKVQRPTWPREKNVAKARELASKTIDSLMDAATPADEKAVRKRRLVKGPSPFRGVRVDGKK
jgi:hypothetical protein